MKTKLLTGAFLLAALAITAQTTEKKQATVRIKKVENINGVEKVTDTTFTTNDVSALKLNNGVDIQTINITGDDKNDNMKKMIIINDDNGNTSNVKVLSTGDGPVSEKEMQEIMKEVEKEMKQAHEQMKISEKDMKISEAQMKEAEKAMKEIEIELQNAENNPNGKSMKKVIIVNDEGTSDGKTEKKITKIVMLNMNITDASTDDMKRIGAGAVDNKVDMENMKLYPNPNDGKFNLNFNLKNKGDAEITVYDLQGKQVYNEKLPNFAGEYDKPIDISSNAKGIYFVKIQQGKHTQVKKISLD